MEQALIGKNAGTIWTLLNGKEKEEVAKLKKESKLSEAEFWTAIGWLSRENKLTPSKEKKGRKMVDFLALND